MNRMHESDDEGDVGSEAPELVEDAAVPARELFSAAQQCVQAACQHLAKAPARERPSIGS